MIIPEEVASRATSELSDQRRQEFFARCNNTTKTTGRAYAGWFFTVHYFYLGKPGINVVFWLTFGGLFVWWIIDLVRIPRMVKLANERLPAVYLERAIRQQQEHQKLLARFGDDETIQRIKKKQIRQGDPVDFLVAAYGKPLDIDKTVLKSKVKETWKYRRNPQTKGYRLKFMIEDGRVVGWEDKR